MDSGRLAGLRLRDHQCNVDGNRGNSGFGRRKPLILIADAHVSKARGNAPAFFRMLDALARCDDDLVFLGDIFDLWVALPRYENELHRQFLAWCRSQKKRRSVGFIEGNHEYYLAENHPDVFTWCSSGPIHRASEGLLFCHGDQVNRQDRQYLTFRKLSKNPITRKFLSGFPLGPALVEHLKRRLKKTNMAFRRDLPVGQIETYAQACGLEGIHTVFIGHFHQQYTCRRFQGVHLYILPAWFATGCVSRFNARDRNLDAFVPACGA